MSSADGAFDSRHEDKGDPYDDDGGKARATRGDRRKTNSNRQTAWKPFEDTIQYHQLIDEGWDQEIIDEAKQAYDKKMASKLQNQREKEEQKKMRRATRVDKVEETDDDIALQNCAQGLRALLLKIIDARHTLQRTDYQTTPMWSDLITLTCNWFYPNTQRSGAVTSAAEGFAQKIKVYITEDSTEANGRRTLSHNMQETKEYIISLTQLHNLHNFTFKGEELAKWFRVTSMSDIPKEKIGDRIEHWTETRIRNCTREIALGNYVSIEELKASYLKTDHENMAFYKQTASGSGTRLYDAIAEQTNMETENLKRLIQEKRDSGEDIQPEDPMEFIPEVIARPLWIFKFIKENTNGFELKLMKAYKHEGEPPVYLMYTESQSGTKHYDSLTRLTEVPAESADGDTEQTGNNEVLVTRKELSKDEKEVRIKSEVTKYMKDCNILLFFHDKVVKYLLDKHANDFDDFYANFSFQNVSERKGKKSIRQKIIEEALIHVVQKALPEQVRNKLDWLKSNRGRNCEKFYEDMAKNPLNIARVNSHRAAVTWPVDTNLELDPNWILNIVDNILPDEFLNLATPSMMQKWMNHPFRDSLTGVAPDKREFYINSKIMDYLEGTKKYYNFVVNWVKDCFKNFQLTGSLEFKFKVVNAIMRYYNNPVKNSFENSGTNHDNMERFVGEVTEFVDLIEKLDKLEEKLKGYYDDQRKQNIKQEMDKLISEIIISQVRKVTRSENDSFLRIITEKLLEHLMTSGQDSSIKTKLKLFLDPAYQNQRDQLIKEFQHPAVNEALQHSISEKINLYFEDQGETLDSVTLEGITNSIMLEFTEAENEDERIRLRKLFMDDDKKDACNAIIQDRFQSYKDLHRAEEVEPLNRDELAAETTHDHNYHNAGSQPSVEEAVNAAVTGFMIINGLGYTNYSLHAMFVHRIMDDNFENVKNLFLDITQWEKRNSYLAEVWKSIYESQYAPAPSLERQEQAQFEGKVRQEITAFFRFKNIITFNNNLAGELFDMIMKYDRQKVDNLFGGHTELRSKKIYMERVWDFVKDVKSLQELERNHDTGARNQLGVIIYKQVEYYFLRHKYNRQKYNLGKIPKISGILLEGCYDDESPEGVDEELRQLFLNPANESDRDKKIEEAMKMLDDHLKENPGTENQYERHPETVTRFLKDDAIEEEEIIDNDNDYNQHHDYQDHDKGNTTENQDYEDKYKSMLANLSNKPRKDKNGRPYWDNVGNIENFRLKCRGHKAEPLTIEVTEIKEKFEQMLQQLTTQEKLSRKEAYQAFQLAFKSIVNKSLTNLKEYMSDVVNEMAQTDFHQVQSQWPKMISGSWDRWHWCVKTFREMVRSVMANDSKESEEFFSGLIEEYEKTTRRSQAKERMMLFDVVDTNIYPDQSKTKSIHTIRYVETIPKGDDIDKQKGKRSKYFMPYNNMNPANLLNCEIYLDGFNVSNGWRNDILKQFARMKNAWMQTFVQTLKERADIGGRKNGKRQKVMDESLFQFKLDPNVVQRFVDDMGMTEEQKGKERKEAEENNEVPRRYFVLPEGCLRITSNNFSDPKLGEQFQAFLAKFYPRYVQDRKWYDGESMTRARQLFTARYRAEFFEAVYIYTRIEDKNIDIKKFEEEHKKLYQRWQTENKTLDEINSAIRDTVKKERAKKAWAKLPDANNPHILIYGAQIANPFLVCEAGNPFIVRE